MRQSAVYCSSTYAAHAKVFHLVFHERDERGDDNGHPFHGERRHLKRDALSAACRHESEGVMTACNTADDIGLYAAEIIVSPVFAEYVAKFFQGRCQFIRKAGYLLSAVALRHACECFPPLRNKCRKRASF